MKTASSLTVAELERLYGATAARLDAWIRDSQLPEGSPERRHLPPGTVANFCADMRAIGDLLTVARHHARVDAD